MLSKISWRKMHVHIPTWAIDSWHYTTTKPLRTGVVVIFQITQISCLTSSAVVGFTHKSSTIIQVVLHLKKKHCCRYLRTCLKIFYLSHLVLMKRILCKESALAELRNHIQKPSPGSKAVLIRIQVWSSIPSRVVLWKLWLFFRHLYS